MHRSTSLRVFAAPEKMCRFGAAALCRYAEGVARAVSSPIFDEVKQLYDDRFCRMWEFYLAASEAAFRVYGYMVFQIQLAKRQDVVPRTRDYVGEREAQLRQRERQRDSCLARGKLSDSFRTDRLGKAWDRRTAARRSSARRAAGR